MKAIQFSIFFIFLIAIYGCEEDKVWFLEPQPSGVDSDSEIRKKFHGTFLNEADSSYLIVSSDRIVYKPFIFKVQLDSGDVSSEKGNVNLSINTGDSTGRVSMQIRKNEGEDSVMVNGEAEEEFFNMKKGGIPKYHKGYLFLNSPFEEGSGYRVRILKLTREGVILSRIASDSVLHLLENESFVSKDAKEDDSEEQWKLNPTRKQLKKMMNMGLFSSVEAFKKIK